MSLTISDLRVSVDSKQIINKLSLTIEPGTVHAIMGPNGSGKSTLANALMGHPKYSVTAGTMTIDGTNITALSPDKKARAGLFLSPQYPPEIAGVSIANFLRLAVGAARGAPVSILAFHKELLAMMDELSIDHAFAGRHLNKGFSGGEKKRLEILQLLLLQPRYAILDETDSGLDVDALRIVAAGINRFRTKDTGVLLITHYNRILEYVEPDFVHIMKEGKIVKSGGKDLAREIEVSGYVGITK